MVAAAIKERIKEPLIGPISLAVYCHFQTPKSWSKAKTENLIWTPHLQTPDADNLLKSVLDGANGVAFDDDKQVAWMTCKKVWSHTDQVLVTIKQFNFFNIGRDDV